MMEQQLLQAVACSEEISLPRRFQDVQNPAGPNVVRHALLIFFGEA